MPSAQLQQSLGVGKALAISGEGYRTNISLTIKNPAPFRYPTAGDWAIFLVVVAGPYVPLAQPISPSSYDDVPQEEIV